MAYKSFEDLEVWQRACRFSVEIFRTFDSCKNYSFKDQIQRASLSIPSNIAEGQDRDSKLEFKRFLSIAKGSAAEVRTQLYIARKLEFIDEPNFKKLLKEIKEISAMLQGLRRSLEPKTTLQTENRKLKTEN